MPRIATVLHVVAVLLAGGGCVPGPQEPEPFGDAEINALFIGNSLTAANDLPGMVADIAAAAGRSFDYRTVLRPNSSLEDHWYAGVAGIVRNAGADVVILQQGPSSVGANPLHLRSWAATLAPIVREAGGEPALLMVWPDAGRTEAFGAVRDSYLSAAEAVDGLFIPAGESWRAIWEREPSAPLYGPDGFHPSRAGTFAAALTTFAVLFEEDVRQLEPLVLEAAAAALFYEAVHATVEEYAGPEVAGSRGLLR